MKKTLSQKNAPASGSPFSSNRCGNLAAGTSFSRTAIIIPRLKTNERSRACATEKSGYFDRECSHQAFISLCRTGCIQVVLRPVTKFANATRAAVFSATNVYAASLSRDTGPRLHLVHPNKLIAQETQQDGWYLLHTNEPIER